MSGDDRERDVHEGVVEEDGSAEPEPGVAFAVPEQKAGDEEERGEGGGLDGRRGVELPHARSTGSDVRKARGRPLGGGPWPMLLAVEADGDGEEAAC